MQRSRPTTHELARTVRGSCAAATDGRYRSTVLAPRELPLSLDDAQPGGLEGQPDDVHADRLTAQVNGMSVDLLIFYGGAEPTAPPVPVSAPSAEAGAMAQEQLARLEVPPPC